MTISDEELRTAATELDHALAGDGHGDLEVLGWGEVSATVAFEATAGPVALKWLPPFPDATRWDRYRTLFDEYRAALAARGVPLVPSELRSTPVGSGVSGVCVQPRLPAASIGPRVLAGAAPEAAGDALSRIFDHVGEAVDATVGLDAQLSNWALLDGVWTQLDLTTPLLRDPRGRDRLDAAVFLAALPAPLRAPVRLLLLRSITSTYHRPRSVALDLVANLLKERLDSHLPLAVEVAGGRFGVRFTVDEVRRHYRADARLWRALLALRRFDRRFRRAIGRPYPFLLPGPVER